MESRGGILIYLIFSTIKKTDIYSFQDDEYKDTGSHGLKVIKPCALTGSDPP